MTRYLIDVYKVEIPPADFRQDDIAESTEDHCDKTRDYYFQVQGNTLDEIADRIRGRQ